MGKNKIHEANYIKVNSLLGKDDCNMRTRSKELQEAYDEYDKIKRKIESSMNDFFDNPTQEGLDKLSKYLSEQVAPDYSKVEKLIEKWKGLQ